MTRIYRKDINHVSEQISRIQNEHTPVCVVHIETSGLDPDDDEILEISIIRCHFKDSRLQVEQTYHSYINHKITIPANITNINHITAELLADAPDPYSVAKEVQSFMGSTPIIVGFSADFACNFIKTQGFLYGYPVFPEQVIDIQYLASCCMDKSIASTASLKKIVKASHLNLDISNSEHKALAFIELFNYFTNLFPRGKETAQVKKMHLFAPSRRTRYIYIDTDHGRVSVDACSGFVCEETPGFFDTVNIENLIDRMFGLRHVTSMWDFIKSF